MINAEIRDSIWEMVAVFAVGNPLPFHKMNITEMQREAALAASEFPLNWEKLGEDSYRKEFIAVMEKSVELLPTLETMYVKLSNGKSVVSQETDSPLPFGEVEKYRDIVGEELYSAYILREIYRKFQAVEDVMTAAYPLDNPPTP